MSSVHPAGKYDVGCHTLGSSPILSKGVNHGMELEGTRFVAQWLLSLQPTASKPRDMNWSHASSCTCQLTLPLTSPLGKSPAEMSQAGPDQKNCPADPKKHELNKWLLVKVLCFGKICYTAETDWHILSTNKWEFLQGICQAIELLDLACLQLS